MKGILETKYCFHYILFTQNPENKKKKMKISDSFVVNNKNKK